MVSTIGAPLRPRFMKLLQPLQASAVRAVSLDGDALHQLRIYTL